MKCFVGPCTNKTNQGNFSGNVCVPCANLAMDIQNETVHQKHYYFAKGVVQFICENWREVVKQSEEFIKGNRYRIRIGMGKPFLIHIHDSFYTPEGYHFVIYKWHMGHTKGWSYVMEDVSVLKAKINRAEK